MHNIVIGMIEVCSDRVGFFYAWVGFEQLTGAIPKQMGDKYKINLKFFLKVFITLPSTGEWMDNALLHIA